MNGKQQNKTIQIGDFCKTKFGKIDRKVKNILPDLFDSQFDKIIFSKKMHRTRNRTK